VSRADERRREAVALLERVPGVQVLSWTGTAKARFAVRVVSANPELVVHDGTTQARVREPIVVLRGGRVDPRGAHSLRQGDRVEVIAALARDTFESSYRETASGPTTLVGDPVIVCFEDVATQSATPPRRHVRTSVLTLAIAAVVVLGVGFLAALFSGCLGIAGSFFDSSGFHWPGG
jgi:hypothetical protein